MVFNQNEILGKVNEQLTLFKKDLEFIRIELFPTIKISSSEFCNNQGIKNVINKIKKNDNPIIYNIICLDESHRILLLDRYFEFHIKNSSLNRGIDRLNISRYNKCDSESLYIGSSMLNIGNRIKQHLGGGNFRTYSLHLSKWAPDLCYNIELHTYAINHQLNKVIERPLLEMLEQSFWDHFKPVFGKRSGLREKT